MAHSILLQVNHHMASLEGYGSLPAQLKGPQNSIREANLAFDRTFAVEVRRARTALNLSQEKLASRANLHRNYVGMIERGERAPTLLAIEGIAKGLRLKVSELVARAEDRL
jgi:ribosome-binding protein aMBF1 (putative translation factor)